MINSIKNPGIESRGVYFKSGRFKMGLIQYIFPNRGKSNPPKPIFFIGFFRVLRVEKHLHDAIACMPVPYLQQSCFHE